MCIVVDICDRLHNLAFRRIQLSAAQRLPLSSFSFSSLLDPYALEHSDGSSRRDPRWTSFTDASLTAGLAAALARSDSAIVQGGMERRWRSSDRRVYSLHAAVIIMNGEVT
jgi:hypothetical protein